MSQAGLPDESFELPEGKCTIGSSPSCQIRLAVGQARPLQCLLVHSADHITVTRWAPGILLNGLEFTSAPLLSGDCLSIGEVQLRLESAEQDAAAADAVEQSSVALLDEVEARVAAEIAPANDVAEPTSPSLPADSAAEADLAKLHSANQQARQRFRRLIGTLRELREESRGLDQHVNVLSGQLEVAQQAQAKLSTELIQVQAIATERESQFSEELDRAIAELSTSYEKANTAEQSLQLAVVHREQLQEQVAALSAECERLQTFQAANQAEKQEFEHELASREVQLQQLREEFAFVQQGLEASIAELHEQNQSLRTQLEQVTAEFERQFAEYQQELEQAQAAAAEQSQRQAEAQHKQFEEQIATIAAQCESLENFQAATIAENDRLAQELLQRDAQHKQFEEQIATLAAERASLEDFHAAALAEKDRLAQELEQRDAQIGQLREELAQVQEGLEASVAELHEQNQVLREQLAKVTTERDEQLAERERRLAELQQELQRAQEQAREAKLQRDIPDPIIVELEDELTVVRGERQQFAGENHRLTEQIADAEKRIRLLEIDVHSANTEWQLAQKVAARLQDDLLTAEAHAADLDAKLADMACTTEVEHATECDQMFGQLTDIRQELAAREQAISELTAERDHFTAQLATTQQELTDSQEHLTNVYAQLSDLQAQATEAEKHRTQLTAALNEREMRVAEVSNQLKESREQFAAEAIAHESRLAELNRELTQKHDETAAELNTREAQIAKISNELSQTQGRLTVELNAREARITEITRELSQERERRAADLETREAQSAKLTSELNQVQEQLTAELSAREAEIATLSNQLNQTQERLTSELESREARIAELSRELTEVLERRAADLETREGQSAKLASELIQVQEQLTAELRTREVRIEELDKELRLAHEKVPFDLATREGELVRELTQLQEQSAAELSARESRIHELANELQQSQDQWTAELSVREARNAELAHELRQTQDQLTECAAQGERLNELYQQAQAELATVNQDLSHQVLSESDVEQELAELSEMPPAAPSMPNEDPRDEHEPRIVRTLDSIVEAEIENVEAKPIEEFQPASFIDRYSHIFDDEAGTAAGSAESVTVQLLPRKQNELETGEGGDESDLLEAYMANMMRRVRGESSSEAIATPLPRVQLADGGTVQSNPVERMNTLTRRVAAPEVAEPLAEQGLIDLNELKGTSQKPPLPTSLSAMRELANISARQAIAKHRKRRHFEGALSKLLVSAIAGGTAGYMLLTANSYTSPYFIAGCGVAIVSGFWGFKLLGILLEMVRDGINDERTPAELSELEEPLPIDGTAE